MRPTSSALAFLAAALVTASIAACTDRNPAAVLPAPETPPSAQRGLLLCSADVRGGTVDCRADASRPGGASADLIVGTPYVTLTSSNVVYDSAAQLFRFDVTVRNELPQGIGVTVNGRSPRGIRVFFHAGPTVTQGSGSAVVANPDGVEAFTAAGQPYFQYDTVLYRGETTRPKQWRISLPPSVDRFEFALYVSAAAPDETGHVDIQDYEPQLLPGGKLPLRGTIVASTGETIEGVPITWSSSDTTVVRVDSAGVLTGVSPGQATITATGGTRTGSMTTTVSLADTYGASVLSFDITPDSVDVSGGPVTVGVTIEAADGGVGVADTFPVLIQSYGTYLGCTATRVAGTARRGTWTCSIAVNPWVRNGYYASQTLVPDRLGNRNGVGAALRAASSVSIDELYADLEVTGSTPDVAPAMYTGLSIAPDSVDVGSGPATVVFEVSAVDPGSGVDSLALELTSDRTGAAYRCRGTLTEGDVQVGRWSCPIVIPENAPGGTWRVSVIRLYDRAGNWTTVLGSNLPGSGSPPIVHVTSPQADETPPTIGTVTVSPDTLDISAGPGTITVSLALADGSGVAEVRYLLFSRNEGGFAYCNGATLSSGTPQNGTWTCTLQVPQFSPGGPWLVSYFEVLDAKGNRTLKSFSRFSDDTPRVFVKN